MVNPFFLLLQDEFEDDAVNQKPASGGEPKRVEHKEVANLFDLLDAPSNELRVDQMTADLLLDLFDVSDIKSNQSTLNEPSSSSTSLAFDLFKKIQSTASFAGNNAKAKSTKSSGAEKPPAWMDLFADLDPLANPASMEKKISGPIDNSSAA